MHALSIGFPRWLHRLIAAGVAILSLAGRCFGGAVTLPPASRADNLCDALGTEAPCAIEEVGHVRGTLMFLVTDTEADPDVWGTLLVQGKTYASRIPTYGARSELEMWQVVQDPQTVWDGVIADRRTWQAFRTMAHVTEGVPVIAEARPARGGVEQSADPGMATTVPLRVRVSLVRLR